MVRLEVAVVQRRFTPDQANRALPLVRKVVADLLARRAELRDAYRGEGATPNRSRLERLEALQAEIQTLLAELEQIGCEYRDGGEDVGVIDFPGQLDGHEVVFCWRTDEPHLCWYHESDSCYAGRRPIPPELLGHLDPSVSDPAVSD